MKIYSSNSTHTRAKGFTLLEIVIVLGIIAVIIGGSILALKDIGRGAEITVADADINNLTAAVLSYKTLAGQAPTTQQGLEALYVKPTTAPIPKRWASPGGNNKEVPKDPWGNTYNYRNPGKKDTSTFEIYSYGPDKQADTDDDMSSQDN
jgi:general secretion pathway protein G